jgi:MFS family permease
VVFVKLKIKRIIIAGVVVAVVAQIIHSIFAQLDMKYYILPTYLPIWSKLMMPAAGPPPVSFMLYSLLFGIVGAILMALTYAVIKKGIPGKNKIQKGIAYGLILVLVSAIPYYLAMILLIGLPLALLTSWLIAMVINYVIGGVIIAAIIK